MKIKKNFIKNLVENIIKNINGIQRQTYFNILEKDGLFIFFVVYFFILFFYLKLNKILQFDLGFIDSASIFAEHLVHLYNTIWIILVFVIFFCLTLLIKIIYLFNWQLLYSNSYILKNIYNFFYEYFLIVGFVLLDKHILFSILRKLNFIYSKKINLNIWYSNENIKSFLTISEISEYRFLEIIWCFLPIGSLLFIAAPTFSLIFSLDPNIDPFYTIKIVGHQWYWNYQIDTFIKNNLIYQDYDFVKLYDIDLSTTTYVYNLMFSHDEFVQIEFDSIMKSDDDLIYGTHRLLEVDNRLYLPIGVPLRLVITSTDVIHSWAIPSLGLKVDAVPGRLNQFIIEIKRPGVFYGQCSEICGPLHGFMPIVIEAVTLNEFKNWLYTYK